MQLLLGMVLFTVCLFMFTTVLVYHCFFAAMSYSAEILAIGSWWCGFMVIKGGTHWDRIVMENRCLDGRGLWIGEKVQLHPVNLTKSSFSKMMGSSFLRHFFSGDFTQSYTGRTFPVLRSQALDWNAQENLRTIFSHVSASSTWMKAMKVDFPAETQLSISFNALNSFVLSKTAGVVTFLRRLLFGSPCPVAASCLEITRSSRKATARHHCFKVR